MLELRVPPVVLVLLAGAINWGLARALPALSFPFPGHSAAGVLLAVVGAVVAVAGVLAFRRAHTTVNPTTPEASSSVVSNGVYAFSRNPMYLGFLLALAGWALVLANLAGVAVLVAFVLYMNRFQIRPEERALSAKFGSEFDAYMRRVRRWL